MARRGGRRGKKPSLPRTSAASPHPPQPITHNSARRTLFPICSWRLMNFEVIWSSCFCAAGDGAVVQRFGKTGYENLKSQTVTSKLAVPTERIERRIPLVRGHKVMLSTDLADLYGVAPRALAVKRNDERFPEDFMLPLTQEEHANLKSQFVISSWGGARRATPYAFTEQGVAMLSSVLRSKRAVLVNVEIMRAFVRLRQMLAAHADLARKLAALEKRYDAQFKVVFEAIRELMTPPPEKKR